MKANSLRAFILTAERGSISEAARIMQRPRPQVSNWIADLEVDWGLELFDRSTHKPVLTEQGEQLLDYSKMVLQNMEQLSERARLLNNQTRLSLRLGIDKCLSTRQRVSIINGLLNRFPALDLKVIGGNDATIIAALKDDLIDIGLCRHWMVDQKTIMATTVSDLNILGCCSPEHPLADYDELTTKIVTQYRQIDLYSPPGHIPETVRFPENLLEVSDYDSMLELTAMGHGWCICPAPLARPWLAKGRLTILNHPEAVGKTALGLISKPATPDNVFFQWLRSEAKSLIAEP